mmetsp:Transcript_7353/g.6698  ORF Transcript_7353/g.6698 Transcript_7353/m.6698 type:complete len:184 (-) Transcript_7353:530-1081(-)
MRLDRKKGRFITHMQNKVTTEGYLIPHESNDMRYRRSMKYDPKMFESLKLKENFKSLYNIGNNSGGNGDGSENGPNIQSMSLKNEKSISSDTPISISDYSKEDMEEMDKMSMSNRDGLESQYTMSRKDILWKKLDEEYVISIDPDDPESHQEKRKLLQDPGQDKGKTPQKAIPIPAGNKKGVP